jgi:hypothetical protein
MDSNNLFLLNPFNKGIKDKQNITTSIREKP